MTIATDLAADVAASDAVPVDVKTAMAVDSRNADGATETAVKWVAQNVEH